MWVLCDAQSEKIIETKNNTEVVFAPDKVKFCKRENNLKIEYVLYANPIADTAVYIIINRFKFVL